MRERAGSRAAPRLVTASAGNHGRALAHAARALGLPLTVFIAANAPRAKVDAIRAAGAELRECRDYDEAERQAKAHAAGGGGLFISPYSHPDVIAGAGTIGARAPRRAAVARHGDRAGRRRRTDQRHRHRRQGAVAVHARRSAWRSPRPARSPGASPPAGS